MTVQSKVQLKTQIKLQFEFASFLKSSPVFCLIALLLSSALSFGRYEAPKEVGINSAERPPEFDGVGISEKLGTRMDLDAVVTNELGQEVPFNSFFQTGKPTLFSLVYFNCSGLCSLHLNGVFEGLKGQRWMPGKDFNYVVLSFDARDTTQKALDAKANYLKAYGYEAPEAAAGIFFLTAKEPAIKQITEKVGFSYKWLEKEQEWAHASAAIFVTPKGDTGRYMHGVVFEPKTVDFALGEVAQGRLGSVVDQLVWYCFKYDPHQSKYTIYAFRLMQLGAIAIVLVLALILVPYWLRTRRRMA